MSLAQASDAPIVLAITGASGAIYGVRLLQTLVRSSVPVELVISPSGKHVLSHELSISLETGNDSASIVNLLKYTWPHSESWKEPTEDEIQSSLQRVHYYDSNDFFAPIASGSHLTRGMIVCPCSGTTLSGIAHASSGNLVVRAAEVQLKEHRKLVLVNRETPLSVLQLENMHRVAQAGAVMLPAMPGWYHDVRSVVDLVDFVVARILDHVQIPHQLMKRWGENQGMNPNDTSAVEDGAGE